MEELARRLVQGVGVPKDQQAGAGWLLRAAQRGSPIAAFNVAVMYERGFVVERDSTRAVEWYRRAADANMPMAKHNLALLLREGKGVARNGNEAVGLLRSAARQGMAASMLALGDFYEHGDSVTKDPAMALAWFAIAAEFERQTSRSGESPLAQTATQRAQALRRVLMPGELERAQQIGQSEFRQIVEALQPPKLPPPALPAPSQAAAIAPAVPTPAPPDADLPGWPAAINDQIRVIQQALLDLKYLRDKPDGAIGPMTRAAIRTFQRSMNLRETGEPTKDVYAALQETIARRDAAVNAAKTEPKPEAKTEPPKAVPAKPPLVATIDVGKPEASSPPSTSTDLARQAPKPDAKPAPAAPASVASIDVGKPEPPPPPPTSADLARLMPKPDPTPSPATPPPVMSIDLPKADAPPALTSADFERVATAELPSPATESRPNPAPETAVSNEPAAAATIDLGTPEPPPEPPTSAELSRAGKPDPNAWPATINEQVMAIQRLLRDVGFLKEEPDGIFGPITRTAILDYENGVGLVQTGEPTRALFDSLREMRRLMGPKPN
jgi:peptidoglycan hydrolase-like protein with peptidoglycan-binding domain